MIYLIKPVPKPRMTQSDKWKRRACVLRYWEFKDEVLKADVQLHDDGYAVVFVIPMPKSWSKKKKAAHLGMRHTQKPDVDNLVKALNDAVKSDDSGIWNVHMKKVWGEVGAMEITPL